MTIKGQDYKLKYTLRALFIYEQKQARLLS